MVCQNVSLQTLVYLMKALLCSSNTIIERICYYKRLNSSSKGSPKYSFRALTIRTGPRKKRKNILLKTLLFKLKKRSRCVGHWWHNLSEAERSKPIPPKEQTYYSLLGIHVSYTYKNIARKPILMPTNGKNLQVNSNLCLPSQ